MSEFKDYLFDYGYDGERWSITIQARSPQEAQERIDRLQYAEYAGELVMTIPAWTGAWFPSLICTIRNWWRKRGLNDPNP